jgi:hypothetical protein
MANPRRRVTYEDLLKVSDTKVAEIIDGELIVSPRPAFPHAHAGSVMSADLINAFHRPPGDPKGPGGWWLLNEPELHFGADVVVPVVGYLWIVDPLLRLIEVYRLDGNHWLVANTFSGTEPARIEPFDAIELDIARWWLDIA